MIIDAELMFSDKQTVSATGSSTNTVPVTPHLDAGFDMHVHVVVHSESGTSPTLALELEGSTDNVTFATLARVNKPAGRKTFGINLHTLPLRKYLRLRYVCGGGSPVFNITAMLVAGQSFDATDNLLPVSPRIS